MKHIFTLKYEKQQFRYQGKFLTKNDGLIPGAEAGFVYEWTRQHQNEDFENKKKYKKLKKKMNKLTKRNKVVRHK